ncbi:uncharacterized protein EAE97_009140 [Botrytis byssoidea]|uniref:Nudix hydrolase domain-containing protein n=1 Tax=Botrytis byssoidea TaxID=139641 RepID=A0A9P5LX66_9HELO|nr:uncharacterized protein EAE97_009140 [Botrytis byssoidea]KAF7932119.1 hypothetical protein EAE97_009140 [Botrytis byssoidea]
MSTPTPTPPHPRIGVGIFLLHPTHPSFTPASPIFLMGQRLGSHGAGLWAHPGGHLEFGEELEECAIREVEEETGLRLRKEDVKFLTATNSFFWRGGEGGTEGKETLRDDLDGGEMGWERRGSEECGAGEVRGLGMGALGGYETICRGKWGEDIIFACERSFEDEGGGVTS